MTCPSQVHGATIYMRDVAHVRDGFAVQQNIVAQNRTRAALLTVLKSAEASTLDIIKRIKEALPGVKSTLPKELEISELFDQSIFVRASINGVLREGVIAACLTALMILLFLGSWRSTLVVATSIPLSILCSVIVLGALGQTLNIMTLGGLALAVGILVDDATVEVENIHRNLAMKKPMVKAILDGASQIATPAFVSTICICIVFVPIFFLSGVAKFLFVPLAMAVIFAMLASYLLSRTVVPTMVKFLLKDHLDEVETDEGDAGGEQKDHSSKKVPAKKPEAKVPLLPAAEAPLLLPEHADATKAEPQKPQRWNRTRGVMKKTGGFFRGIHEKFQKMFNCFRDGYTNALGHRSTIAFSSSLAWGSWCSCRCALSLSSARTSSRRWTLGKSASM